MTKQDARLIRKAGAMLLGASAALACAVAAQAQSSGTSAYVTDTRGSAIRTATYLCWHTGFWTPAAAIADCDPDLVARPAPIAATPAAPAQPPARQAPAPVVKAAPPAAKKGSATKVDVVEKGR